MATRSVFISYARTDRDDVHEAADLLRAGGVKVFLDVMQIDFGERWKEALYKALFRCERVMVFWSQSAAASEWVEREWRYALELGKKIVPTLLDLTPLPSDLAEFQAVRRLRASAVTMPAAGPANRPPGAPAPDNVNGPAGALPPLPRRATASVFAAAAFLGCAAGAGYLLRSNSPAPTEVAMPPTPTPAQAPSASSGPTPAPASASSSASAAEALAARRQLREQHEAAVRAHQRKLARLREQAASPERDAEARALEQRLEEEETRWALADRQLTQKYDLRQPPRPARPPARLPEPDTAFQGLLTQHRFALAVLAAMALALCVRIFAPRRSASPNAKKFVREVFSA